MNPTPKSQRKAEAVPDQPGHMLTLPVAAESYSEDLEAKDGIKLIV